MLFSTTSQFIVLLLLFFGGLILGLGIHPGGKKWRKRFQDESGNYAQFRRDADKRLSDANRRIAELERDNAALQDRASATPALPDAVETPPRSAASAAVPAFFPPAPPLPEPEPVMPPAETDAAGDAPKKSWFTMIGAADLGRIRGIDAALKTRLFGLGMTRFEDITGLSAEDEMALEQRLSLPAGYITREQWREQAALLQDGKEAEQAERFPAQ